MQNTNGYGAQPMVSRGTEETINPVFSAYMSSL